MKTFHSAFAGGTRNCVGALHGVQLRTNGAEMQFSTFSIFTCRVRGFALLVSSLFGSSLGYLLSRKSIRLIRLSISRGRSDVCLTLDKRPSGARCGSGGNETEIDEYVFYLNLCSLLGLESVWGNSEDSKVHSLLAVWRRLISILCERGEEMAWQRPNNDCEFDPDIRTTVYFCFFALLLVFSLTCICATARSSIKRHWVCGADSANWGLTCYASCCISLFIGYSVFLQVWAIPIPPKQRRTASGAFGTISKPPPRSRTKIQAFMDCVCIIWLTVFLFMYDL